MKKAIQYISIIACYTAFALSTTGIEIEDHNDSCPQEEDLKLISDVLISDVLIIE